MGWLKKYLLAVAAVLCGTFASFGQFTINSGVDTLSSKLRSDNSLLPEMTTTKGGYFDPAAHRAEMRRLRRERNSVEFNATLQTSLQQYENWKAGGNNAWSVLAHIDFRHIYKRDEMSVDYTVTANYGMNLIDNALFKNRDDLKFTGLVKWTIHNTWSFSGSLTLETQFANGFKSRTDHTLISRFMAPAKLAMSPGFTWQPTSYPIIVTLSPIGGNVTTMLDRSLAAQGLNGVPAGKLVTAKLGPSVNVSLDRQWGKDKQYRYRSTFYIFSNLQSSPIIQWNNTVDVRLTKYLSTTGTFQLYYDEAASKRVQYNYSIMIGLAYKFKNK